MAAAGKTPPGARPSRSSRCRGAILRCRADLRAAARVGRTRRPATGVLEEWPSPPSKGLSGGSGWYRTRLTRRLAPPDRRMVGARLPRWRQIAAEPWTIRRNNRGISALSWGKPCGSTLARLPAALVPLSSKGCGSDADPRGCGPAIGGKFAGIVVPVRHTWGDGTGGLRRLPVLSGRQFPDRRAVLLAAIHSSSRRSAAARAAANGV